MHSLMYCFTLNLLDMIDNTINATTKITNRNNFIKALRQLFEVQNEEALNKVISEEDPNDIVAKMQGADHELIKELGNTLKSNFDADASFSVALKSKATGSDKHLEDIIDQVVANAGGYDKGDTPANTFEKVVETASGREVRSSQLAKAEAVAETLSRVVKIKGLRKLEGERFQVRNLKALGEGEVWNKDAENAYQQRVLIECVDANNQLLIISSTENFIEQIAAQIGITQTVDGISFSNPYAFVTVQKTKTGATTYRDSDEALVEFARANGGLVVKRRGQEFAVVKHDANVDNINFQAVADEEDWKEAKTDAKADKEAERQINLAQKTAVAQQMSKLALLDEVMNRAGDDDAKVDRLIGLLGKL